MMIPKAEPIEIIVNGHAHIFDLDDPILPDWVENNYLTSDNYPYNDKYPRKKYDKELLALQEELVRLQYWLLEKGERVILIFEGRDSAGKGSTIKRLTYYMNPRHVRVVALPKPSDREQGQWYYQRYVPHFPTAGEMTVFDRSWYNRAGVEPVMGFCTEDQYQHFLQETPAFEHLICREKIHFFKFWLNIGQETQLKRFHDRRHDPLKIWKLSPIDIRALGKWEAYTRARDKMFETTHCPAAPWVVVKANDKRRARLNVLRYLLRNLPYAGKREAKLGAIDEKILNTDVSFL
ncbi:MAG: polyphosphate kinase 2 [bacterium]